jgi:hypothetical protein
MQVHAESLKSLIIGKYYDLDHHQRLLAEKEYFCFARKKGDRCGFLWLKKRAEAETWSEFIQRKYYLIFHEKSPYFPNIRKLYAIKEFVNRMIKSIGSCPGHYIDLTEEDVYLLKKLLGIMPKENIIKKQNI